MGVDSSRFRRGVQFLVAYARVRIRELPTYLILVLTCAACMTPQRRTVVDPVSTGASLQRTRIGSQAESIDESKLNAIEPVIRDAMADRKLPGAVVLIAQGERTLYQSAIALAIEEVPTSTPGTRFIYSDINFLLLGDIVRRVSGVPLDRFAHDRIFAPLGMSATAFAPPSSWQQRIAPTDPKLARGIVH